MMPLRVRSTLEESADHRESVVDIAEDAEWAGKSAAT
jgi:hypothetical protein